MLPRAKQASLLVVAGLTPLIFLASSPRPVERSAFRYPNECDAILRSGIFDKEDITDFHIRHTQVRNITCDRNAGVDLDDATLTSSEFCSQNYETTLRADKYTKSVRHASQVIASAWASCISNNNIGLRHYFTTTKDPRKFQYTIVFDVIGEPAFSTIRNWSMSPASVLATCRGVRPRPGSHVPEGGVTLDCERSVDDTVSVTVDATSGIAPPITLPAVVNHYLLKVSPPDDLGWVSIGPKKSKSPQEIVRTSSSERIYLNNYFKPDVSVYTLTFNIQDQHPGSDFKPCWSGRFEITKDGVPLVVQSPRCCNGGCGGVTSWSRSFDLDVSAQKLVGVSLSRPSKSTQ
jgi:hypothetical protein